MRRRRLTGLFVVSLLVLSGMSLPQIAEASEPTIFQDFEADADLAGTTASLPQVDAVSRAGYATHGQSSVRFTVGPANAPGATSSSGITLHAGTASLPSTDWSGHAAVGFDFFTDLDHDTVGRVTIRDTNGTGWGADYPIHARGWTPFNAQLSVLTAAGIDVRSISYVSISIPRAVKTITGYYDAFRLVDTFPYDQSAFGDRAASALLHLCRFGPLLIGLSARLDELHRQVDRRGDAADRRLDSLVHEEQGRVDELLKAFEAGAMTYDAYASFNTAVATAQSAVPRLANTIQARAEARRSDFGLESADSMSLVFPKDVPFVATGPSPTLRLAKGESESTQAVVLPYAENLQAVSAHVTSVRGPHGRHIADADLHVTVDPVGSLYTTPTSAYRRAAYTGWTPDPIRADLTSVDVPATDVQSYWIQVRASDYAPTGRYSIQLTFSASFPPLGTMDVTAKVPSRRPSQPNRS